MFRVSVFTNGCFMCKSQTDAAEEATVSCECGLAVHRNCLENQQLRNIEQCVPCPKCQKPWKNPVFDVLEEQSHAFSQIRDRSKMAATSKMSANCTYDCMEVPLLVIGHLETVKTAKNANISHIGVQIEATLSSAWFAQRSAAVRRFQAAMSALKFANDTGSTEYEAFTELNYAVSWLMRGSSFAVINLVSFKDLLREVDLAEKAKGAISEAEDALRTLSLDLSTSKRLDVIYKREYYVYLQDEKRLWEADQPPWRENSWRSIPEQFSLTRFEVLKSELRKAEDDVLKAERDCVQANTNLIAVRKVFSDHVAAIVQKQSMCVEELAKQLCA